MKRKQSFFMGVILLASAGIIVKLLGFVYRVALTNLPGYGDEGNGIYGAGFQVYLLLYAFCSTGFSSAISKMIAERMAVGNWRAAHKVFKVGFWLLFMTGLVCSTLFFTSAEYIANLISNPRAFFTMAALSPTIFFVSVMSALKGYFQGMQNMAPLAVSQILEQMVKTVVAIFLAYLLIPHGAEIAAAGATAGTTIGAAAGASYLWGLYYIKKRELWTNIRNFSIRKKSESILHIIKNIIKISFPISLGAIVMTAANIIDLATVMRLLEKAGMDNDTANRLYGILTGKCYVLTNFPVSITMALSTSLVPAIAWAVAKKDLKSASEKIIAAVRLTLIICLPSSVGMAILSKPILLMLFPSSSDGAYLLSASASVIVFIGLTQIMSGVLQGLGKPYIPTIGLFAGALVKLSVNYYLMPVPSINIKGAVYGTLACYIVSTLICIIGLIFNFRLNLDTRNSIIKPMIAAALMGIATYYTYFCLYDVTGSNTVAAIISILISACVFFILLFVFGALNKKDLSRISFGNNIARR
ncbi:MAG TPA: polysaccharide biosynthesis protein [Clostridiaceae bacterium]|nr:polysaccharide biosynthesis protein [Clostridiaceae bacterium]